MPKRKKAPAPDVAAAELAPAPTEDVPSPMISELEFEHEHRLVRRRARVQLAATIGKGLLIAVVIASLIFNLLAWREARHEAAAAPGRAQEAIEKVVTEISDQLERKLAEHDAAIKREFAEHERRQRQDAERIVADISSIGGSRREPGPDPDDPGEPDPPAPSPSPSPSPTPRCLPIPLICITPR